MLANTMRVFHLNTWGLPNLLTCFTYSSLTHCSNVTVRPSRAMFNLCQTRNSASG
jgi:hypothetical protein